MLARLAAAEGLLLLEEVERIAFISNQYLLEVLGHPIPERPGTQRLALQCSRLYYYYAWHTSRCASGVVVVRGLHVCGGSAWRLNVPKPEFLPFMLFVEDTLEDTSFCYFWGSCGRAAKSYHFFYFWPVAGGWPNLTTYAILGILVAVEVAFVDKGESPLHRGAKSKL